MDKRTYEGMFIVDSAVDVENNGSSVLEEIKSEIARQEGEIVSVYPMGKRTFAYTLKKKRDGIYFVIYFDIDPQRITKFKDRIKLNTRVLREMIVTPYKVPYPEELLKSFARRAETNDAEQKDAPAGKSSASDGDGAAEAVSASTETEKTKASTVEAVEKTPETAKEVAVEETPEAAPKAAEEVVVEETSDIAPETTEEVVAEKTADAEPETAEEVVAEETPDAEPETAEEVVAEKTAEAAPETAEEVIAEETPDAAETVATKEEDTEDLTIEKKSPAAE